MQKLREQLIKDYAEEEKEMRKKRERKLETKKESETESETSETGEPSMLYNINMLLPTIVVHVQQPLAHWQSQTLECVNSIAHHNSC